MPNLKFKSKENLEAARLLIDNGKYSASVHCAYYSFHQLSKHVLKERLGVDYEMQAVQSKSRGSHEYVCKQILCAIDKDKNRFDYNDVNSCSKQLKRMRTKADYNNEIISEEQAEEVLLKAKKVANVLSTHYSIAL